MSCSWSQCCRNRHSLRRRALPRSTANCCAVNIHDVNSQRHKTGRHEKWTHLVEPYVVVDCVLFCVDLCCFVLFCVVVLLLLLFCFDLCCCYVLLWCSDFLWFFVFFLVLVVFMFFMLFFVVVVFFFVCFLCRLCGLCVFVLLCCVLSRHGLRLRETFGDHKHHVNPRSPESMASWW